MDIAAINEMGKVEGKISVKEQINLEIAYR